MAHSVTLKINEDTFDKIKDFYSNNVTLDKGEYVVFSAKTIDDVIIKVYQSSKGLKVVFMGEKALDEAHIWDEEATINLTQEKVKTSWKYLYDQIGSDEVGTGDFFGPIIVVASFVSTDIINYLKEIGVDDSKKISDQKIMNTVPLIIDKVIYSKLQCSPLKYNEMIDKGYSMNAIKAILHNEALQNVLAKIPNKNVPIYIDQFCSISNYYSYLEGKYNPLINNVEFETKGESYYPSVAVSSMIARYAFLQYFQELKEKYQVEFYKGASKKVDEFAKELKNMIGLDELSTLVKKNFKNYSYLLDEPK
ncbi:MAG: ribonuclease HIII [Bacillales bacterium]|nr:ribonuclease HIII [Bacillales bacterium]